MGQPMSERSPRSDYIEARCIVPTWGAEHDSHEPGFRSELGAAAESRLKRSSPPRSHDASRQMEAEARSNATGRVVKNGSKMRGTISGGSPVIVGDRDAHVRVSWLHRNPHVPRIHPDGIVQQVRKTWLNSRGTTRRDVVPIGAMNRTSSICI